MRREGLEVRRLIVFGLSVGWLLALVGGFLFFCVPSRLDPLWGALMLAGFVHLGLAVALPQALVWSEGAWMAVARWQGWLIMSALLSVVYFVLIWPASCFSRRRTRGFAAWESGAPVTRTCWEPMDALQLDKGSRENVRSRSLPVLLAGVIGFFFHRGDYLLVLIVMLLVVLGLLLYFVESSALAPFIYTLF